MASEPEQNQPTKKPILANNHGEEEEDFISRLPNIILHMILSKLKMRDAAVTTALSKRRAPVFTTLPYLKIDANSFNPRVLVYPSPGEPYVENPEIWIYSLCSVLDSRKTPIEKFEIDVGIFKLYHKHFNVVFRELCVAVADNDLRRMISRCNAMEKLVIIDCHKVQNIVICGPSLLELMISLHRPVGISLKSVPRLAFVEVSLIYDYDMWMNYHASFEERYAAREDSDEDIFSLSPRDFNGRDSGKTFEGTNEATNLVAFLNRIRSVKDLRLNFSSEYRVMLSNEGIVLPTRLSPKCYLVELKKLHLSWPSNYHTFNTIVSCLLNSSPHLTEIIICVTSYDNKYRHFSLELDF
ncbi:hypothetical protein LUZ63_013899 [Rhynchospora breviuscula]|uniref:F-box domain-containing protein n=1 Tax=Rhynchospora breviuscula TaxID=2022672 RepID=A0A9Q0HL00_9POAL|nr:hypothetical protein LUZ63_013899 [Rhynchospora breviuscula]